MDAVFAAFSWVLWTGSASMLAMEIFKGGLKSLKGAKTDQVAKSAMKEERAAGV